MDVRSQVALGCRVLAGTGQGDFIWGHVSHRDPDDRGAWMKRSGLGLEEVAATDVHLVDDHGQVLEGAGKGHSEYAIHTEILAARPDVQSVVHTHPRYTTAFAALDVPLHPVSHEAVLFVPPPLARFTETGDLILTAEMGRRVAASLGDRNAVLLVNHGIVTVGEDVPTAVMTAVLLERACWMQMTAMSAGQPVHWSDDDEARTKRAHTYTPAALHQAWEYLVRSLAPAGGVEE